MMSTASEPKDKWQKRYMAYYLNEMPISVSGNIHEKFKILVTFL